MARTRLVVDKDGSREIPYTPEEEAEADAEVRTPRVKPKKRSEMTADEKLSKLLKSAGLTKQEFKDLLK
jgi:hypothetical protein